MTQNAGFLQGKRLLITGVLSNRLTELQHVYEVVLDRTLEKKAFRTRMLATDLLEPLSKQKEGPNRPAQLFRLKSRKRPVFFARTFGK